MNQETRKALFSMDEFAKLGGGQIAYVREIEAQDAMAQFPGAGKLPPAPHPVSTLQGRHLSGAIDIGFHFRRIAGFFKQADK